MGKEGATEADDGDDYDDDFESVERKGGGQKKPDTKPLWL